MARKINVKLILELREAGMSRSAIASTRKISRNSVSDVFNIADEKRITFSDVSGMSDEEAYGSNMLRERFLCYIKGGAFEAGGADHKPCDDPTEPLAVKAVEIPYDMHFGNNSPSWESKGVSFLDITRPGSAKGVAYLITREQFEHVACQENGGCPPEGSINWYNTVVELGTLDGCDVVTITSDTVRPCNAPAAAYLDTL